MDPFQQNFTLIDPVNGPFNVSIPDLNEYVLYKVQICTNYGAQLGASLAVLVMLLLLTKPEKRFSKIFILNTISLVFNVIRNVFQILYFTSAFSDQYAYLSQDFSRVPANSYRCSIVGTVFVFLLQVSVEASLCLQTRVVCLTLRSLYRRSILAISILVAGIAIGFHFAYMVMNDIAIVSASSELDLYWIGNANNIATIVSIFWFCTIFVAKLGCALYQRKRLGLAQFGPMQVLLIMGCQTLMIPAILSILQYEVDVPALSSNALTAVAIFLPLSSMWASASIEQRTSGTPKCKGNHQDRHRHQFGSKFPSNSSSGTGSGTNRKLLGNHTASTLSPTSTLITSPTTSANPRGLDSFMFDDDLEKQGAGLSTA